MWLEPAGRSCPSGPGGSVKFCSTKVLVESKVLTDAAVHEFAFTCTGVGLG